MRICVIFNPVARGDKARHFREQLSRIASDAVLKPTQCAGDARRLAAEAVTEKFETIVAAGGDGTINEVLNGIGDAPGGFETTRLGVLPLGTVNVFARELKIPTDITGAWKIIQRGNETKIDLPRAEFTSDGKSQQLYFAQLAGAGLDARAIELVSWKLKKKTGPLAYVVAGMKALAERKPQISVRAGGETISGELILIGNGILYGGDFAIFANANLRDGKLDACVFPRVNWWTLLRVGPTLWWRKKIPAKFFRSVVAEKIELSCDSPAAVELDGEWAGKLPVTFSVEREKLRMICP